MLTFPAPVANLENKRGALWRDAGCSPDVRVLGGSIGVHDLLRDGYDAVFIGTGTWRPNRMHIPGETTMKGIFASGDVVTGAKTVVEAVKYSKMIADAMDEYVRNCAGD